jgi:hypothetical protein
MASKKTGVQLDHKIAEALTKRTLRVPLSKTLWWAIKRRSGIAVFNAARLTSRGYMFESSDPGMVRAFWKALGEVYYRIPWTDKTDALLKAAKKKREELQPTIEASWPEALTP